MSVGDQVLASLRRKYPDGAYVLVYFLSGLVKFDQVLPRECSRAAIDAFHERVNASLREIRQQWVDPTKVEETAAQNGMTVAEVRERNRAAKRHMGPVIEQAKNLAGVLVKRLRHENTRSETLLYLRAWHENVTQSGLSPQEAARSLKGYLNGGGEFLRAASDGLTLGILRAMERGEYAVREGDTWPSVGDVAVFKAKDGTQGREDWRHYLMPAEVAVQGGEVLAMPDSVEHITQYARNLNDEDADLLCLAMAKFVERARSKDDHVPIHIDELMSALHYRAQRGGTGGKAYRLVDKQYVRRRFEQLENGYLTTVRHYGKKTPHREQSRFMAIMKREGGQEDLDGVMRDWERCEIVFGRAWSQRLFEDRGRLVALMQAKALQYHPQYQRIEKRLAKRLAWYWRMNQTRGHASRTVLEWLRDDVGDERFGPAAGDRRFERREAERLEEAFDRLKADGQIAAWTYSAGDRISGGGQLPRGWLEQWLEREIVVEIPEDLRLAYRIELKPKAETTRATETTTEDLATRFRQARLAMKVTQLAAAEATEIHFTTLNKIERGKQQPTSSQVTAMETWLRTVRSSA